MEEIFVIGHKNPDTDTVVSSIVLGSIMRYTPAIAGPINDETAFVLNRFGLQTPQILADASGKKLFLVDHNEVSQMVNGGDSAEVIGILDHHKVQFSSANPIYIHTEPIGSTASLIAKLYMEKLKDKPHFAGALLGAIMSDTVVFKSITTTEEDKVIATQLAEIAGILDISAFGFEVKQSNATLIGKSMSDIVESDFKEFVIGDKKIGVGGKEIMDIKELPARREELIDYLSNLRESKGYEAVFFSMVDMGNEKSEIFAGGNNYKELLEGVFKYPVNEATKSISIPGLISRKKQVVPALEAYFKSN